MPIAMALLMTIALSLILQGYDGGIRYSVVCASLDNLVEFAPIKPNAAALLAVIDFDALSIAHHKRNLAYGAWHAAGCMCHNRKLQSRIVKLRVSR